MNFSHERAINLCQSSLCKERPRSKNALAAATPPYAATYVFGFEGIKILKKMFNFNSNALAIISRRVCALRCLSSPWAAQREAINAALTSVYAMLMTDYLPILESATSIIMFKFNERFCAQRLASLGLQKKSKFAIFQCRHTSDLNIHTVQFSRHRV